jgi:hypothetical protein
MTGTYKGILYKTIILNRAGKKAILGCAYVWKLRFP